MLSTKRTKGCNCKNIQKLSRQPNGAKYSESENKNDNFTVNYRFFFLSNSENYIHLLYIYYGVNLVHTCIIGSSTMNVSI